MGPSASASLRESVPVEIWAVRTRIRTILPSSIGACGAGFPPTPSTGTLQPKWLCAEGLGRTGSPILYIVGQLLAEKASKLGNACSWALRTPWGASGIQFFKDLAEHDDILIPNRADEVRRISRVMVEAFGQLTFGESYAPRGQCPPSANQHDLWG